MEIFQAPSGIQDWSRPQTQQVSHILAGTQIPELSPAASRGVQRKWSSWNSNQAPNMECRGGDGGVCGCGGGGTAGRGGAGGKRWPWGGRTWGRRGDVGRGGAWPSLACAAVCGQLLLQQVQSSSGMWGVPGSTQRACAAVLPFQYDEHVISPKEFVHLAGKSTLKDWKRAIRMNGIMLRWAVGVWALCSGWGYRHGPVSHAGGCFACGTSWFGV